MKKAHYFSVKKTIEGLRAGEIDEAVKMRYYVAMGLISSISLQWEAWAGVRGVTNGAQFAAWFRSLLITTVGTVFIFDMNKGHGRFLEKIICLSVPIMLQMLALYITGSLVVGAVAGILGKANSVDAIFKSELFRPATEFIFAAGYASWLGFSVHRVNKSVV